MELKADLPYPSLNGITKDYGALKMISPAYAGRCGELTAVLTYVYQSIVFGEYGKTELSKTLLSIAVSEMRHLELLGTAITRLGAPPVFTACPPYPVGYYSASNVNYNRNPRQMICIDICGEENAIADYERMLCALKNPSAAELIARILEDEKIHLKTLKEILEQF